MRLRNKLYLHLPSSVFLVFLHIIESEFPLVARDPSSEVGKMHGPREVGGDRRSTGVVEQIDENGIL